VEAPEGLARPSSAVELVVGGEEEEPPAHGVVEHLQRGDGRLYPIVEVPEPKDRIVVLRARDGGVPRSGIALLLWEPSSGGAL